MSSKFVEFRTRAMVGVMKRIFSVEAAPEMVRIGSSYGGWWIPSGHLNQESICYCAGAGEDITFDLGLIRRYGCHVWTIDPTPRAAAHVTLQDPPPRLHFVPLGLAYSSGSYKFFAPANPEHVSHSIKNLQRTNDYFTAQCVTVKELQQRLGHDHVDLVKLDIEGAEHDVVGRMISDEVRPPILCLEFDQPCPIRQVRSTLRKMQAVGYRIAKIEGLNMTLVNDQL
jgi:FkbM family methyltransferase